MKLEKGYLYHIYNQGNNKRRIFYSRQNYLFFKRKLRTHITPFADIIAWCLMPNHFHLMVYVREEFAQMEKSSKYPTEYYRCSINYSMGILLRSYTRAINKQENFSGSLFKSHTKAKCINYSEGFSPNFYKTVYGNMINVNDDMESYSQTCFDYIHNNPVKSGLVMKPSDWEFSSAREYLRLTTKPLVCQERAKEFGLVMG